MPPPWSGRPSASARRPHRGAPAGKENEEALKSLTSLRANGGELTLSMLGETREEVEENFV